MQGGPVHPPLSTPPGYHDRGRGWGGVGRPLQTRVLEAVGWGASALLLGSAASEAAWEDDRSVVWSWTEHDLQGFAWEILTKQNGCPPTQFML